MEIHRKENEQYYKQATVVTGKVYVERNNVWGSESRASWAYLKLPKGLTEHFMIRGSKTAFIHVSSSG